MTRCMTVCTILVIVDEVSCGDGIKSTLEESKKNSHLNSQWILVCDDVIKAEIESFGESEMQIISFDGLSRMSHGDVLFHPLLHHYRSQSMIVSTLSGLSFLSAVESKLEQSSQDMSSVAFIVVGPPTGGNEMNDVVFSLNNDKSVLEPYVKNSERNKYGSSLGLYLLNPLFFSLSTFLSSKVSGSSMMSRLYSILSIIQHDASKYIGIVLNERNGALGRVIHRLMRGQHKTIISVVVLGSSSTSSYNAVFGNWPKSDWKAPMFLEICTSPPTDNKISGVDPSHEDTALCFRINRDKMLMDRLCFLFAHINAAGVVDKIENRYEPHSIPLEHKNASVVERVTPSDPLPCYWLLEGNSYCVYIKLGGWSSNPWINDDDDGDIEGDVNGGCEVGNHQLDSSATESVDESKESLSSPCNVVHDDSVVDDVINSSHDSSLMCMDTKYYVSFPSQIKTSSIDGIDEHSDACPTQNNQSRTKIEPIMAHYYRIYCPILSDIHFHITYSNITKPSPSPMRIHEHTIQDSGVVSQDLLSAVLNKSSICHRDGNMTVRMSSGRLLAVHIAVISPLSLALKGNSLYQSKLHFQINSVEHRLPLSIGHRGCGVNDLMNQRYVENSIGSFNALVYERGITFAELDLNVTQDRYPVVFHDSLIVPKSSDNVHSEALSINALRFDELSNIPVPVPFAFTGGNQYVPLFSDILKYTPLCLNYDLEIKYPMISELEMVNPNFSKNEYVNALLECLLQDSIQTRSLFFSSFDPDICLYVRHKQSKYPVMLLTEGGYHEDVTMTDQRRISIIGSIEFAAANGLLGIVTDTRAVNEEITQLAFSYGLLLMTYGGNNNSREWRSTLRNMSIHGICADSFEGDDGQSNDAMKNVMSQLNNRLNDGSGFYSIQSL